MAQQNSLATLLAHIGRLKVLSASLAEANATEAQTMLDIRSAMKAASLDCAAPSVRAAMLAAAQNAASERRRSRRIAITAELDAIRAALPALAEQAALDLGVLIQEVRGNDVFVPEDRQLFERAA